jgi:hypothetical protein
MKQGSDKINSVVTTTPQTEAARWLNPAWPFNQNSFPPDVWESAQQCDDPQGYLHTWLKLEKSKIEIQLLHGKYILAHWESLKRAGYTTKQLEDAAESGEGFERMMRDAFIEELIPLKFRDSVRKLERDTSLWRFPPDFIALADAKVAVEKAAKRLPLTKAGSASDFLPDPEGRIESFHKKWQKIPAAERTAIEASRDAALERIFSLSQGTRDEISEFFSLRFGDFLLPNVGFNEAEKADMHKAVDATDVSYLIRLGDCLKKAKSESKKANVTFKKRIEQHRLALFLVEHWLASPRLRGTWLHLYLNNPQFFNEGGVYLSPRWLGSGALTFLLQPKPAKRNKSPGLCFFSLEAIAKVCLFFLKRSITRSTVAKTINRLGLKQCAEPELLITRVEQCQNKKESLFVS